MQDLTITLNRTQATALYQALAEAVHDHTGPVEVIRVGDSSGGVFPLYNNQRSNRGIVVTD